MNIHQALELPTEMIFSTIENELAGIYKMTTDSDNYLICHGTSNTALVAHIDTCDRKTVKLKTERTVVSNPGDILGADDRAGVYGILQLGKRCFSEGQPLPTLIFTNHEEVGGIGVKSMLKDNVIDFAGINLLIEMDRKGCNEYVHYSYKLPKEVEKYVKAFGWVEGSGSYSDIADISTHTKIPSINVSCGYYNQHTQKETLHVDELYFCIDRVYQMLKSPITKLYELEDYPTRSFGGRGYSRYDDDMDYYKWLKPSSKAKADVYNYSSLLKDKPCDQYYSVDYLYEIQAVVFQTLCEGETIDALEEPLSEDEYYALSDVQDEFFEAVAYIDEHRYWDTFVEIWGRVIGKVSVITNI